MREIYVTSILLACIVTCVIGKVSLNKHGCPNDFTMEKLLPHRNCNMFYHCVRGDLVVQKCESNLQFNTDTQQCDWPDRVVCGDRVTDVNDFIEAEAEDKNNDINNNLNNKNNNPDLIYVACEKEGSDGTLLAHENCNKFYKCSEGLPVAISCPRNLLYNQDTEQCDWPENVNCGERVIIDESDNNGNGGSDSGSVAGGNNNPSEAPSICATDGSDGVLVAHEYCNKFYKCSEGLPVPIQCPLNLLFNPDKDQCDWPENVNCIDRIITDSSSDDIERSGGSGASGGNDGGGGEDGAIGSGWVGKSHAGGGGGARNNGEDTPVAGGNDDPSEAPTICAADGSDGVLLAHEYCNKFYKCSEGVPVALRCPLNLLFNPNTDQCDWPENVNCGDRIIPDGSDDSGNGGGGGGGEGGGGGGGGAGNDGEDAPVGGGNDNPIEAPTICAADGSDGVLVAHEYCNKFYKCSEGVPVALRCPLNLLFNPNTDQCDWPENVNCGDRIIPDGSDDSGNGGGGGGSGGDGGGGGAGGGGGGGGNDGEDAPVGGGNDKPSEAPTICAAEGSDGILVAHENCNKFYICSEGVPVAIRCPLNLLFNPNTDQCDWPENVNCGDRIIPDGSDDSGNGGGGGGSGGDEGGGGGAGNDGEDAPVGGGNDNPIEAPTICAADGSDGVLVAHEYCNKFYKCSEGVPVALRCPLNLLFNPNTDQCDWPENVNCGDRIIPDGSDDSGNGGGGGGSGGDGGGGGAGGGGGGAGNDGEDAPVGGGNDKPSEAPTICAAEGSDGVLVAHENCNKFYKCSEGVPVALRCPLNLLFNPNTDQCDWPENVNCGDRIIPDGSDDSGNGGGGGGSGGDGGGGGAGGGGGGAGNDGEDAPVGGGNDKPSEAPTICAAEGSDGVLVAHENCNKFYICSEGVPVAIRCPLNLLFNPNTDQCDWPENVNCGDRIIPDGNDDSGNGGGGGGGEGGGGGAGGDGGGGGGAGNDGEDAPVGGGNDNPIEAPTICAADGSDGVLVAHENCNKFYICSEGAPVAIRCPLNLLFNPNTDQCDWPENVNCGDRIIPDGSDDSGNGGGGGGGEGGGGVGGGGGGAGNDGEDAPVGGGNDNPIEAPTICAADGSDGVLVAHEYCNKFYKCSEGVPVALRCPLNLLFNPNTDQCDWPENVNCGDRIIPDGSDDSGNGGGGGGGEGGGGGGGGAGNDGEDAPVGGGNDNPIEAPTICAADGSDGVLVAHEYCNKFYKCSEGVPVALRCPLNLLFNPNTDQCDWPENVNCGDRIIPDGDSGDNGNGGGGGGGEGGDGVGGGGGGAGNDGEDAPIGGGNDKPSEAPTICAADGSDGILVAHENCNKYYKCSEGVPVAIRCPLNLLFNPNTDQCDWPENVNCGDRIIPDGSDDSGSTDDGGADDGNSNDGDDGHVGGGNDDSSNVVAMCATDGSDDIMVAHEYCNKFYKCSEGLPIVLQCPVNLLYNPYKELCDWPDNVDCGNRIIPIVH